MIQPLPAPVAAYLAATTPEAVAACFAEDAVVHDERRTHRGKAEILDWYREVSKIDFTREMLSRADDGDWIVVTQRIAGSFRGSPVVLDSRFRLIGGQIAELDIR